MSRRYPLELPPEPADEMASSSRRVRLREEGFAIRAARLTAALLLGVVEWRRRHGDLARSITAVLLFLFGISLIAAAGLIDEYLHRGVETGVEAPYVVQPAGKELATNVNLVPYSGGGLTQVADAIDGAGFTHVRQVFSWAEIEQESGDPDFSRYDPLVDQLEQREISIIAVVDNAPDWAMIEDPTSARPQTIVDPDALSAFTQALTARYPTAVMFVQIWDRPNLESATSAGPIMPSNFTRMLAAGSNGAKQGNSEVKVLTPELAVTSDIPSIPTDLDYLNALYVQGAQAFFDIVGITLDGTHFSPDDRRVSTTRYNVSRAVLFRELVIRQGDSAKPIWATSFGWAAGGDISRETQAEFVARALERSWEEWPWMGPMVQWQFLAEESSPDVPYAIVLPDGSATPLYERLVEDRLQSASRMAHTGFSPMDSSAVSASGNWQDQHLEGRTFKTTSEVGASVEFRFSGTGAVAFMRSGPQVGNFKVTLDGEVITGGAEGAPELWDVWWYETSDQPFQLVSGLDDTEHVLTITLAEEGQLTLGGMVVAREAPFTWPIMLMAAAAFISMFLSLRSFIYLIGTRAGHLARTGAMPNPQLPTMPNWRPSRRA